MNKKHQEMICSAYQLGCPSESIIQVLGSRGGSFMWRVNTETRSYAIKQLSPEINLNNKTTITKYELSETIADAFIHQDISAVSALKHAGKHLFLIENTGYLVYPWVNGYILKRNEISETHALKIAEVLAKLHTLNLQVSGVKPPRFDIHSNDSILNAIEKASFFKCPFEKTLKKKQELILSANDSYLAATPLLELNYVVTHGDLDQLNVIWGATDQPSLIDWESARKFNPTLELIRTSLSWSGIGTENFSSPIYAQMLHTYIKAGGILNKCSMSSALHGAFGSLLNWLLYNINIACTQENSEKRNTAITELNWAMMTIIRLQALMPDLLNAL